MINNIEHLKMLVDNLKDQRSKTNNPFTILGLTNEIERIETNIKKLEYEKFKL